MKRSADRDSSVSQNCRSPRKSQSRAALAIPPQTEAATRHESSHGTIQGTTGGGGAAGPDWVDGAAAVGSAG